MYFRHHNKVVTTAATMLTLIVMVGAVAAFSDMPLRPTLASEITRLAKEISLIANKTNYNMVDVITGRRQPKAVVFNNPYFQMRYPFMHGSLKKKIQLMTSGSMTQRITDQLSARTQAATAEGVLSEICYAAFEVFKTPPRERELYVIMNVVGRIFVANSGEPSAKIDADVAYLNGWSLVKNQDGTTEWTPNDDDWTEGDDY
jgi:flagellin-like hook-associated protein FlgL